MIPTRLRVAAINFLNPAPLMWDFNHPPLSSQLAERYQIHSIQPAQCAIELLEGRADLGLIPIAALTPELTIVPGCTIASLDRVRSIQLIVKLNRNSSQNIIPLNKDCHSDTERSAGEESPHFVRSATESDQILASVRSIAADTASRSSLAYTQILFNRFLATDPAFIPAPANPIAMLHQADAALLIGDPALLALESRAEIEASVGPCLWLDLAHEWIARTGLPWVAAVWAVRSEALTSTSPAQLLADLEQSRDHGLANIDQLVSEWTPRIAIPSNIISNYLNHNIHYRLTPSCIEAIQLFRRYAAEAAILPPLPNLRFLQSSKQISPHRDFPSPTSVIPS
ncbi:MAG: menaquinone biosynthesis protein [Acidobacteriaceae bacterium]|nr:menaquinone biosynthesis protein [Acidobacteriaceae bacterium]